MNVCSNSNFTLSAMFLSITSLCPWSTEPPRSSSQFALQAMLMFLPEISDLGRATGVASPVLALGAVVVLAREQRLGRGDRGVLLGRRVGQRAVVVGPRLVVV